MEKIHEIAGPALLLAGPGTGKTYTLGLRLKYLIEEKEVDPDQITVITFTSDAARNMRSRISDPEKDPLFLPYKKQPTNIITMHSLGFKIIRSYAEKVGLHDTIRLIPSDLEKSILLADAAQLSGHDRSLGQEVSTCRQLGKCQFENQSNCHICETYKGILRKCSSVDYDEQILLAVDLLSKNPEILVEFQLHTQHLLVDEYQDINSAQHELIKLLSRGHQDGLYVVGDDDQSIYSWRGGSPAFIRDFSIDFGVKAQIIALNKSYRCHRNILKGSLSIVENFDGERLQKEPFEYEVPEGPQIRIHNAPSDKKEAKIVRQIVQASLPSQDVLILVPQRQFATAITKELRSHQIGFSTRASIPGVGLPLISRLNDWIENPSDSVAFRRCVESFMDRIDSTIPSRRARKDEMKAKRATAFSLIAELWNNVLAGTSDSLWTSLEKEREEDELLLSLYKSFELLLKEHSDGSNVTDFIANIFSSLSPWREIKSFLAEIVSWVDSIRQSSLEGSDSSVRIMTFQAAKGLEAKVVCVLGLEEGVIPKNDTDLPEQSRLLFVSMTRAINELHLFHARVRSSNVLMRNVFAGGKPNVQVSRFLEAIPREFVDQIYHRT